MGNALKKYDLSEQDYLDLEASAGRKSEFVNGETYLMAGASAKHNRISINLTLKLNAALGETGCEVFMADMKLRIAQFRAFYYPDVMLCCQPEDNNLFRESPCLVAEVLSPSTAGIDEREKWFHYREMPSLRYYLLIDAESRCVRLRSRDAEGWWEETLEENETVSIRCGEWVCSLSLADIYQRTDLAH